MSNLELGAFRTWIPRDYDGGAVELPTGSGFSDPDGICRLVGSPNIPVVSWTLPVT